MLVSSKMALAGTPFTPEEDEMLLDMINNNRRPRWRKLAEKMALAGYNRTEHSLICRYRLLPKPYEFKAVRKLVQSAICTVMRLAKTRARGSSWQKANREKSRARAKRHRDNHAGEEEFVAKRRAKDKRNRPQANKRDRDRRVTDPSFMVKRRIRCRVWDFIVNGKGLTKASKTFDLVGCSPDELRKHLQSQIPCVDKTTTSVQTTTVLDHLGKETLVTQTCSVTERCYEFTLKDAEIDHIFPLCAYDLTDPQQQRMANHWSNFQPLLPEQHKLKGTKMPTRLMASKVQGWAWPPGIKGEDLPTIY